MSCPDAIKLVAQVKVAEQRVIAIVLSDDPLALSMQWREELNILLDEWSRLSPDLQAVLLLRKEFLFSYARFLDHVDPKVPEWSPRLKSLYKKYLDQIRDSEWNSDEAAATVSPAAPVRSAVATRTFTSQAASSDIHETPPHAASQESPLSAEGVDLLRSDLLSSLPMTPISLPCEPLLTPQATTGPGASSTSWPPPNGDESFVSLGSEGGIDDMQPPAPPTPSRGSRPHGKESIAKHVTLAEEKLMTSSRKNLAVPTNQIHDPPCASCKGQGLTCTQNVSNGACCACRTGEHKCDYSKKRSAKVKKPPADVVHELSEQDRTNDELEESHSIENRTEGLVQIPSNTGLQLLQPAAVATAEVDVAHKDVIDCNVVLQEEGVASTILKPLWIVHSEGPTTRSTSPRLVPMGIGAEQSRKITRTTTHRSSEALDKQAVNPLMSRVMNLESEVHGLARRLDLIANSLSLKPEQVSGQAFDPSTNLASRARVISTPSMPPQLPRALAPPSHVRLPVHLSILRDTINGQSSSIGNRVPVVAVPALGGQIQAQGTPFYGPNAITARPTMSEKSASSSPSNTTDMPSEEKENLGQGGSSLGTPENALPIVVPLPHTGESMTSGYSPPLAAAAVDLGNPNNNLLICNSTNPMVPSTVENGPQDLDLAAPSPMSTCFGGMTSSRLASPPIDAELLPVASMPLLEALVPSPLAIATVSRRYRDSYDEVDFSMTDDEAAGRDVACTGKAQPQLVPVGESRLLPPEKESTTNSRWSQSTSGNNHTVLREEGHHPENLLSLCCSLGCLSPNIALPPAPNNSNSGKRKVGPSGLKGRMQKRPKA